MAELATGKERQILVGECKWWKSPAGRNLLEELKTREQLLPAQWQGRTQLAIFSLSGFTEELRSIADREKVALVDGEALLRL